MQRNTLQRTKPRCNATRRVATQCNPVVANRTLAEKGACVRARARTIVEQHVDPAEFGLCLRHDIVDLHECATRGMGILPALMRGANRCA